LHESFIIEIPFTSGRENKRQLWDVEYKSVYNSSSDMKENQSCKQIEEWNAMEDDSSSVSITRKCERTYNKILDFSYFSFYLFLLPSTFSFWFFSFWFACLPRKELLLAMHFIEAPLFEGKHFKYFERNSISSGPNKSKFVGFIYFVLFWVPLVLALINLLINKKTSEKLSQKLFSIHNTWTRNFA